MIGTWDYTSSFWWAASESDTLSCEVSSLALTVGDPANEDWPYTLQASASGGVIACSNEGGPVLEQKLVLGSIEMERAICVLNFWFTVPTSTGTIYCRNTIYECTQDPDVATSSYWEGAVLLDNPSTGTRDGRGEFRAVRR
jgi:hypothetical protein